MGVGLAEEGSPVSALPCLPQTPTGPSFCRSGSACEFPRSAGAAGGDGMGRVETLTCDPPPVPNCKLFLHHPHTLPFFQIFVSPRWYPLLKH